MTSKEYLMQFRNNQEKILKLCDEIDEMKSQLTSCSQRINVYGKVQKSRPVDKMGDVYSIIDKKEREIKKITKENAYLKFDILDAIHEMKNMKYFKILNAVYIDGIDIKRLSVKMNKSYQYIKNLYYKALQEFYQVNKDKLQLEK